MSKQPRTTKLAFIVKNGLIYEKEFEFDFFGGFALSQKHKTIDAFHEEIRKEGSYRILEVSRKSKDGIGNLLSAFNLMVPMGGRTYPVECIYQSAKVFDQNIQFLQCLDFFPLEAKKFIQEQVEVNRLNLTGFRFKDTLFPLSPSTIFYDYLYILALSQNQRLAQRILAYDCFTDLEFNHKKQFASQARSCALYKLLVNQGQLTNVLNDFHYLERIYLSQVIYEKNALF